MSGRGWRLMLAVGAALLLTACSGEEPTETLPPDPETVLETESESETEPIPVSFADFDAISTAEQLVRLHGDTEYLARWNELVRSVQGRRREITQSEVDLITLELQAMRKKPEYAQGELPRVYLASSTPYKNLTSKSSTAPASVAVVDAEGGRKAVTDGNATVILHGNSTKSSAKHSVRIRFAEKTSLLGMRKARSWVLLSNTYDATLLRNQLAYELAIAVGYEPAVQCRQVEVWYSGEYLGVFLLCEKKDAGDTVKSYLDVDKGEILFESNVGRNEAGATYVKTSRYGMRFEIQEPEQVSAEALSALKSTLARFEEALHKRSWTALCQVADMKSIVEFYVISEFFKNPDFSSYSTCYYFKDGRIYSGPPWDFDLAMGNLDINRGTGYANTYFNLPGYGNGSSDSTQGLFCAVKEHCASHQWHPRLMEIPEFREAAREYFLEIYPHLENLYRDNELGQNRIDAILSQCGGAFARNFSVAPWRPGDVRTIYMMQNPEPTYEGNVAFLRDWLARRAAWMLAEWGGEAET